MKDSLSDCYLNPSESVQTTNHINYVQTIATKPRVIQIPVIDCRKEQQVPNYKDADHERMKALREVTEHRIQQRLFHFISFLYSIIFFVLFRSVK